MFSRVVLLSIILITSSSGLFSQTTDLLISEYVEGSGNNKYLEIYNGTGASVNLGNYDIRIYANGSATPTSTINLSGTLTDGSVYVIANSGASAWGGTPDLSTGSLSFNGDDAVELYNSSTASIIDLFGNIGCDPGSAWTSGAFSTVDKTLVRNGNICSGITSDDVTSCPFNTLSTEWAQYNQDDISDLGSHTNSCTSCTAVTPTVNASAYSFTLIGCNGMTINWTSPASNDGSLVVMKAGSDITTDPTDGTTYTASNTFGNGSDIGTNEFVVYSGNDTSVSVNGLSASTVYYVNVFEYNGSGSCIKYRVSDETSDNDTTTACNDCPYLATMLINSCDQAPCTEGDNEMFFFNSMDYYVSTAASDITVNYGSSSPAPNTYADSFTSNSAAIDSMNADVGCGTTFIDASTVSYIPAHSTFLMLNETVCANAFDWSTICSSVSSEVYVLFTSDATWNSTGQFSNNPGDPGRYFRTIFEGCTIDYNYNSGLPSGDGAYAAWSSSGGTATSYGSDGCSLPLSILPITLTDFNGKELNEDNILYWSTSTEINNDYFTLEKSKDAIHFEVSGFIDGAGNSSTVLNYQMIDPTPYLTTYYRLKQTDFDGQFSYSDIIAINRQIENYFYFHPSTNSIVLNLNEDIPFTTIFIYSIHGQLIKEIPIINKGNNYSVPLNLSNGLYLISIKNGSTIFSKKVLVNR